MLEGTPILLLREGTETKSGDEAHRENLRGAIAVADAIRSTLGPRGMDKMLVGANGDVVISNDGATILKSLEVGHPAAKLLVELAQAQDASCGDGTKSCVILAGELLRRAEELLDERIHPTVIVEGYHLAGEAARASLRRLARPVGPSAPERLRDVAMTSMISKGVAGDRAHLAELAVAAVRAVAEPFDGRFTFDKTRVHLVKRPGERVVDSQLVEGDVLERSPVRPDMPKFVANARLALVQDPFEVRKPELNAEIRIEDPAQVQRFLDEEARTVRGMVDAVVRAGANVLFVEKAIGPEAAQALAEAQVYAVAQVPRTELDRLARASSARLVDRAHDLGPGDLGQAARVEERLVGLDRMTFVSGCPKATSVTLLLRGGSAHVVDEVERSLTDALATVGLAVTEDAVVTGAGACAVELSREIRELALRAGGRAQLAMQAFADALEVIPRTLAESAGMDPIDAMIELRRRHAGGESGAGVNVLSGRVDDMSTVAIEPLAVDLQVIEGAVEAAAMVLRIDTVVAAKRSLSSAARTPPSGEAAEA